MQALTAPKPVLRFKSELFEWEKDIVTNAYEELKWRGLVYDHTESVPDVLAKEKISVYNGFDPTADSLHIGNLVPLMVMARLQLSLIHI